MIYFNSGAMRFALIAVAALVVSACTTTSSTMSVPSETAGSKPMVKEKSMNCPCCASMKNEGGNGGCCSGMKDGCPCCSGMSGGEGMTCAPKSKSDMTGMDHSKMNHGSPDLYAPAMKSMHENMSMAPTGNADVDFMRGMIPHHQGAVDMAKIVLEKGSNPEVKKLAQEVITAQEKEISFMRAWLKKNNQ